MSKVLEELASDNQNNTTSIVGELPPDKEITTPTTTIVEPAKKEINKDVEKYLIPDNLPWNTSVANNIFGYSEIKKTTEGQTPFVYRFIPVIDEQLKGAGIIELQKKLAFIFRYANYDVYKKYYLDDLKYRTALTSGIFGPKTMKMVMVFQKKYMKDHFDKHGWSMDAPANFGMFGSYTKERLEDIFKSLKQQDIAKTGTGSETKETKPEPKKSMNTFTTSLW